MAESIFRKKTMDRISSPEQLSDYLRVTNPSIWVILSAVILILIGILAWSAVGTLETTADVKVVVSDGRAQVVPMSAEGNNITSGMMLKLVSDEYIISETQTDDYGRNIAYATVSTPDGVYDAKVVIERIHPISFLMKGR